MANNLMFYNIPETNDENCIAMVTDFLENTLKLENPDQISVSDAFRIGKNGEKVRPILVKFKSTEHRKRDKINVKNLKGSGFGISKQLPLDVQNRRKELLPIMKNLRD